MVHQQCLFSSRYIYRCLMCYVSKKTRKGLMALTIAIAVFALLAYYYVTMHSSGGVAHIDHVTLDIKTRKLTLHDINSKKRDEVLLDVTFGIGIPETALYEECSSPGDKSRCFWWRNTTDEKERAFAELHVKVHSPEEKKVRCTDITWTALVYDHPPTDCILFNHKHTISKPHWYGGGEMHGMRWPMEVVEIPMKAFVSQDLMQDTKAYGSVLERYWLNSLGVGIIVDEDSPLHVSINDVTVHEEDKSGSMCFKSEYMDSPYQNPEQKYPTLKYTICVSDNMRTTHEYIMNKYFAHPKGAPDERMFQYPIWSTWARYKIHVNESLVMQYAQEIKDHGFNNSQIEIDDMYTTSHGEYNFVAHKFPNPKKMVSDLKKMGFRVTTWVHPFANIDSPAFIEGANEEKHYWLKDSTGKVPALIKWWNGIAATLDTTNTNANDWYVGKLNWMQNEYGIDSFKFDAGEAQYLPINYNASLPFSDPNLYCPMYVATAARLGRQIEVRCGHKSQEFPVFVRMMDKDSNWNYSNGLLTVIPSALIMGFLGYPYILPDMIGGNCYDPVTFHSQYLPDRELYIRWLELTAYLPSMQFSVAPWQYDDEVVRIAKEMTRVHADVVTPLMIGLINDSIEKGFPIIRPLWWIAPKDPEAQRIDSEFLIGDKLLVAPVLQKNARERDVYLPKGKWKDNLNPNKIWKVTTEGKWIRNHSVLLHEIATFQWLGS